MNWPWFSLEQRATGEVLDGAGNESNSMQGGISAYECDKYILYLLKHTCCPTMKETWSSSENFSSGGLY